MRNFSGLLLATLLLGACTGEPTADVSKASPHSGIDLAGIDKSIAPGDDFFSYTNGAWVTATTIPADEASYGVFEQLHEESQGVVRKIIEASANGDFEIGTDEQKVGDLYHSYMNMDRRNELGASPLTADLKAIEAIESHEHLAIYFAAANKLGHNMPFSLNQYADFKTPDLYMMYTYQGGLGLPDREYYFEDDDKSESIRQAYREHLRKMLSLAGIDNAEAAAQTIYAMEERMAAKHMPKEQTRDMVALYNKLTGEELHTLMPDFNWPGYLQEAGIAGIDGVVVTQLDYMQALNDIIRDTPVDSWKTYLRWAAINSSANLLSEELDRQNFEFYGRILQGTEQQQPLWRRGVSLVNNHLGEVVGKVYVKEHFPPAAKEQMLELVENLIAAYDQSIRNLDWMSEATKIEALDKLSKFRPKIGYPDNWRDYSALNIDRSDLFGNVRDATLVEYQRQIDRQGGPVDRSEWFMTPQTVNAYYNPPLNEIVFPAAILQPPFFDMNADPAVNYGAIGAVIGHEIGHGFDDSGSTFDGDGVLRNWWTEDDREEFKKRTGKLVEQYSAFKPFDDLHVNGEFTLGENIGDLGGLSIALLAYQRSLKGAEAPVLDGYTGVQRVFLGYGRAWRSKYREEALRTLVGTNPHAPPVYRTNGVVRNIPEFYEAFGVDESHELYLPPAERVKIW